MSEEAKIDSLITSQQELEKQELLLKKLRSTVKQIDPIKGVWYKSTEVHPPQNLKVICCFPCTDIFWIDYVHDFGDYDGLRWFKNNVLCERTDIDQNPFSWQLPILPS